MKLSDKLTMIQEQMAAQVPAEILAAFGGNLQQLMASQPEEKALKAGDIAPDFAMSFNGESLSLTDLLKNGPVVINFFRGNWCPFCMAELEYYQALLSKQDGSMIDIDPQHQAIQFLFISPQKAEYHTALMDEKNFNLQFISDTHNTIAKKFGLVFQLDDQIQKIYKAIGADLSQFNGDDSFELPVPATYVIDPSGKITRAFVDANYMVRAEPDAFFE